MSAMLLERIRSPQVMLIRLCRRGSTFSQPWQLASDLLGTGFVLTVNVVTGYRKTSVLGHMILGSVWAGLAYVTLFSMPVGFFYWYWGLAQGGVAAGSQLQLLQPFFGLMLAALLLGEAVDLTMIATTIAVILCVAGPRRFA
jgi:drug/metabolite transporter (DMT)-like permease